MKRLFGILSISVILLTGLGLLNLYAGQNDTAQSQVNNSKAGNDTTSAKAGDTTMTDTTGNTAMSPASAKKEGGNAQEDKETTQTFHQQIKEKFIEGDVRFMSIVLICLIVGLAISVERIITLNLSTVNSDKLLNRVENALASGGIESAKEVCKKTRGPVASIFAQGLTRANEGIEMVEKSITSYGSVEMGRLEKGLTWLSMLIAIAPMLGFMGTVIGMIDAFDRIQAEGEMSPSVVAGGIKFALLTTVGGLIVAVILQFFYNYAINKIDALVNEMEDASISFVDMLIKHNLTARQQ